jgi:hypothetical protein
LAGFYSGRDFSLASVFGRESDPGAPESHSKTAQLLTPTSLRADAMSFKKIWQVM